MTIVSRLQSDHGFGAVTSQTLSTVSAQSQQQHSLSTDLLLQQKRSCYA